MVFDVVYKWFEGFILSVDSMFDCGIKILFSCLIKTVVYNIYKEYSVGKFLLVRIMFIYSLWKVKFLYVLIFRVSLI